jgi:hypothetical protein
LVPDEVKVHVDNEPDAIVERSIEGTQLWESVCTGACDRKLPLEGRYRVMGHGIRRSLPLALFPPTHDVLHLDVRPGYSAAWGGGIALVVMGGATIFAGSIALFVGLNQSSPPTFCPPDAPECAPEPENHVAATGGGLTMLVGALMLAGGIGSIALGMQSRVTPIALGPRGLRVTF